MRCEAGMEANKSDSVKTMNKREVWRFSSCGAVWAKEEMRRDEGR
jgi:hypothetical protein